VVRRRTTLWHSWEIWNPSHWKLAYGLNKQSTIYIYLGSHNYTSQCRPSLNVL
jgi:hypothetical protein